MNSPKRNSETFTGHIGSIIIHECAGGGVVVRKYDYANGEFTQDHDYTHVQFPKSDEAPTAPPVF